MIRFAIAIAVSFLPALSATAVRTDGWYTSLVRPPLTPPSWVFGPAWTLLYLLIGLAAALLWPLRTPLLIALFAAHLALNGTWSVLFFGLHQPLLALIDLVLLDAVVIALVATSARVCPPAAWLQAPYLAWICFATWLNAGFWWLNR